MTRTMLFIAIATALAAFVVVGQLWSARRARRSDEDWLPRELRNATLVFTEKTFRPKQTSGFVARVDRGYRVGGELRLVELKTRERARPYTSDIIELSVQRMAVEQQTVERVSDVAYVLVQDARTKRRSVFRVRLLSNTEVIALARRREDVLNGRAAPRLAADRGLCRDCAYRAKCRARQHEALPARR